MSEDAPIQPPQSEEAAGQYEHDPEVQQYKEALGGVVLANGDDIAQDTGHIDLRVNDQEQAQVEAKVADGFIKAVKHEYGMERQERTGDLLTKGAVRRGNEAGQQFVRDRYVQSHENTSEVEQALAADELVTTLDFAEHIIESHRKHKEALPPNLLMLDAIVKLVKSTEGFNGEGLPDNLKGLFSESSLRLKTEGNDEYVVKVSEGSIKFTKQNMENETSDTLETWIISPWRSEGTRLHDTSKKYLGVVYTIEDTVDMTEEELKQGNFASGMTRASKTRYGASLEDAQGFTEMLQEIKPKSGEE